MAIDATLVLMLLLQVCASSSSTSAQRSGRKMDFYDIDHLFYWMLNHLLL